MAEARPWPVPPVWRPAGSLSVHQIADTHIGYRPWSTAEADHMLADLQQGLIPAVDVCVHTGDIVDGVDVTTEDPYALQWLPSAAKGAPSLWACGNHDLRTREPTTRAAWEQTYGCPANAYIDVAGWRIVTWCVDSHVINAMWTVPESTWAWLDEVIGDAPGPVLLAEHYPPWELGVSDINCVDPPARLAELVSAHPQIVGLICGHMHWEINDVRQAQCLAIGERPNFPVVCDVSSMLSISELTRDQSAQLPSVSTYITMTPERWEVRYRMHGRHGWGGPDGMRVTAMDLATGLVSHVMGG